MRSVLFNLVYWVLSALYAFMAAVTALTPGRNATRWVIRRYVRRMIQAMRIFAGIKLEARGRERLPEGSFIIAAKHQSWGDGFCTYSQFDDLAFVTGDHLERFPLLASVLQKLGAIVVNSCGGPEARKALSESAAEAKAENRKILIYPEGHLAKVGEHFRYRAGVWHMYKDFDMPVVPVATNLGLFWPQQDFKKNPGTAVIEFLEPIPTGLPKKQFLERLQDAIEGRTAELVAEARGGPVVLAKLVATPDERQKQPEAA
jgi:1-acyl-sn-glycerol-3-phosphate acyltransferase